MKFKLLTFTLGISALFFSLAGNAAMLGLCNDPNLTQYICCPANGGWIVSPDCNSGASPSCVKDTGLIAGTNMTILQDCQSRNGTAVMYPLFSPKSK